eukprot:487229_1
MPVRAETAEDVTRQVNVDDPDSKQRKLFVKESRNDNKEIMKDIKIIIKKKTNSRTENIDIEDDHDNTYHLKLYDSAKSNVPLPRSNDVKLIVLKDENEFPPSNANYKPNPIDLSTVIKVKNEDKNEI